MDSTDRSPEFQARCVAAALAWLGVARWDVVGFSYGGMVAFKLAEARSLAVAGSVVAMTDAVSRETMERLGAGSSAELLMPKALQGLKALLRLHAHEDVVPGQDVQGLPQEAATVEEKEAMAAAVNASRKLKSSPSQISIVTGASRPDSAEKPRVQVEKFGGYINGATCKTSQPTTRSRATRSWRPSWHPVLVMFGNVCVVEKANLVTDRGFTMVTTTPRAFTAFLRGLGVD